MYGIVLGESRRASRPAILPSGKAVAAIETLRLADVGISTAETLLLLTTRAYRPGVRIMMTSGWEVLAAPTESVKSVSLNPQSKKQKHPVQGPQAEMRWRH